jgi:aminoglycoside phosphotransferase family enzyme
MLPATARRAVPGPATGAAAPTPLATKVAFLLRPSSYPDRPARVEAVETHMSWVFLTRRHAYKLKKPIRFAFLDFRSLASREHFCAEELRLNRRLAPKVYLGVVALAAGRDGGLELGGAREPVEWLVKMHRLPAARMLDVAIRRQTVARADIDRFARLLARFYARAEPVAVDPGAYRKRFVADARENMRELTFAEFGMPAEPIERAGALQLRFLRQEAKLLRGRVEGRRIVETHGDLRPEHVFLGPRPAVIDCLEFRRELRLLDPIDELAFFAVECDRLGAPWIGDRVREVYSQVTGDRPPERLWLFHKSFRALLRAKIALWHLRDPSVRNRRKWPRRARTYIGLALRYAEAMAESAIRPRE